jgi:hypothetical protein
MATDGLTKAFTGEVKVFVFDRMSEIINVEMDYKEPDR